MKLEGSCHCGAVRFSVESDTPAPFQRCYCTICRKTAGGGGFAIQLGAHAGTLEVDGKENITVYQARMDRPGDDANPEISKAERSFCSKCGTHLWLYDPSWPDHLHPHAGVIDTPLPVPPRNVHLMLEFKPDWVPIEGRAGDEQYPGYPELSIADWHAKNMPDGD